MLVCTLGDVVLLTPYFNVGPNYCTHFSFISFIDVTTLVRPEWGELIQIDRKDGKGPLRIIDFIASQPNTICEDFAYLLLNDRVKVKGILETKKNKDEFVRAVLEKWVAAVDATTLPCTWENLVKSMERAKLDEITVKAIRDNTC